MTQDRFIAQIAPKSDGGWSVHLLKNLQGNVWHSDHYVETRYGYRVWTYTRTRRGAQRTASRMLKQIRRRAAHLDQEIIEVTE